MDDEKLEREAAKIIFSAPAKPEERVIPAEPTGPGIPFVCPFCNEAYQVSKDLAGKTVTCRNCGELCRVDGEQASAPKFNLLSFCLGGAVGVVFTVFVVVLLKIVRIL